MDLNIISNKKIVDSLLIRWNLKSYLWINHMHKKNEFNSPII